ANAAAGPSGTNNGLKDSMHAPLNRGRPGPTSTLNRIRFRSNDSLIDNSSVKNSNPTLNSLHSGSELLLRELSVQFDRFSNILSKLDDRLACISAQIVNINQRLCTIEEHLEIDSSPGRHLYQDPAYL